MFGLSTIRVNPTNHNLKSVNPFVEELGQFFTSEGKFYSPENFGMAFNTHEIIFSFGMILLSLCLLDTCEDCYLYKNFEFCWSILEEK